MSQVLFAGIAATAVGVFGSLGGSITQTVGGQAEGSTQTVGGQMQAARETVAHAHSEAPRATTLGTSTPIPEGGGLPAGASAWPSYVAATSYATAANKRTGSTSSAESPRYAAHTDVMAWVQSARNALFATGQTSRVGMQPGLMAAAAAHHWGPPSAWIAPSIEDLYGRLSDLDKTDAELVFERGELDMAAGFFVADLEALAAASNEADAQALRDLLEDGLELAELRSAWNKGLLEGLSSEALDSLEAALERDSDILRELATRDQIAQAAGKDTQNEHVQEVLALRADIAEPNPLLADLSREDIEAARADLQLQLAIFESGDVALVDGFPDSRGRIQSPEMAGTRLADVQRLLAADRALALELASRSNHAVAPPATISEDLQVGLLLAENAIQTLGVPYNNSGGVRFGGESDLFDPNVRLNGDGVRFDCSGLTSVLYLFATGLEIPTHSRAQLGELPRVDADSLKPGDLVGRPGHIGMYIGGGRYIHAPQSGDVVHIRELPDGGYPVAVRPRGENMNIDASVFEVELSDEQLAEVTAPYVDSE